MKKELFDMKIQTAFRLEKELIEDLKLAAMRNRRSLNNYVEYILYKELEKFPNEETLEAMRETEDGNTEKIDDLEQFLNTLKDV